MSRRDLLGWIMVHSSARNSKLSLISEESELSIKGKIQAISNYFEIGSIQPDYTYIENIKDGRGYTVTQYGFCTYIPEVTTIIEKLLDVSPGSPLRTFVPLLPPLGDGIDMDKLSDFPKTWRREARNSELLPRICDDVADALLYRPALALSTKAYIRSPIGLAIFYDTLLQHGNDTDADSFGSIYAGAEKETGGVLNSSETAFLSAFLKIRRSVLLAPSNENTTSVWRSSSTRVEALRRLLRMNPSLTQPISIWHSGIEQIVF